MPFVVIQVIMVGLIIAFPTLVSGGLDKEAEDRRRQGRSQADADKSTAATRRTLPHAARRRRRLPARRAARSAKEDPMKGLHASRCKKDQASKKP